MFSEDWDYLPEITATEGESWKQKVRTLLWGLMEGRQSMAHDPHHGYPGNSVELAVEHLA